MLLHLLLTLTALLLSRALWRRWRYDLHKIPTPPRLPFLGHTLAVMSRQGEGELGRYRGTWWKRLGCPKLIRLDVAGKTFVFVRDMSFARSVCMSRTDPFPKAPGLVGSLSTLIGNAPDGQTLLTTHVITPRVKAVRKIYANGFQTRNMKHVFPKVKKVMEKMMQQIESERRKGPMDFQQLCVKMTLDTIGIVAFETNLGGLDGSRELYGLLIDIGYMMRERGFDPIRTMHHKFFPRSETARKQNDLVHRLTMEWETLTKEILEREEPQIEEKPMWCGLRKLIDPVTNQRISHKALVGEVATIVVSGTDTTGHQLGWLLALLASHPHVMEKLVEEIKRRGLYGDDAREIVFQDLADMTYLTAIIKEGMRMTHVFLGSFFREVPHDMTIVGYRIPKGTVVSIPSNRWMDSEAEWEDPLVFRPGRWLGDEDMSQKYYFGFSFGPRDCVGQKMAMMEMRLAIVLLVSRYSFTPTVPFRHLMENSRMGLVVEAKDGIWLHVTPRNSEEGTD